MASVYEPPGSVPQQPQQPMYATWGGTQEGPGGMRGTFSRTPTGWSSTPQGGGWSMPGVSDSNVFASQGAGAGGGMASDPNQQFQQGLQGRAGQQQQQDMQMAQRQAELQGAAMARQTPGLSWQGSTQGQGGPAAQWQRMMQGMAGMYYRPGAAGNTGAITQMNQQYGGGSDPSGMLQAMARMYQQGRR